MQPESARHQARGGWDLGQSLRWLMAACIGAATLAKFTARSHGNGLVVRACPHGPVDVRRVGKVQSACLGRWARRSSLGASTTGATITRLCPPYKTEASLS